MKTYIFDSLRRLRSPRNSFHLLLKTSLFSGLMLVLTIAGLSQSARAAAGDLDITFGNNGRVLSDFGNSSEIAYAMALQPDGKIVAAGYRFFGLSSQGADMLVARYNPDGTLDSSFGSGGRVTTDFGLTDIARGLVIQPDGKIVVAGQSYDLFSVFGEYALARYNSDGSLDSTFGNGGMVTSFLGGQGCAANALALQTDGKIVVAGEITIDFIFGENGDLDFAVARYNPDGSLDTTFGTGGVVTTDYFHLSDSAAAVRIQPDRKIVAVGTSQGVSSFSDFALVRYLPNGALDTRFGQQGKVRTDLHRANGESASAAVLQADGKIVAGGYASTANVQNPFTLIRYNPNGKVDTTFGRNGIATVNFGRILQSVGGGGLALQADGKIVAAGFSSGEGSTDDFLISRILPTGQLDSSFGTGGKVTTSFGNLNGGSFATALQPDGKIVAVGFQATSNEGVNLAMARYLGN
ncbi:MAG TPA: delta-60 repeat domain-containing protein [Terriglobales bacterium]|jgi:uncharacterized delta-60 repeat protein